MPSDTPDLFKAQLKLLLIEYQDYEIQKLEKQVADGAPRPVKHHFSFAGFFNWIMEIEDE